MPNSSSATASPRLVALFLILAVPQIGVVALSEWADWTRAAVSVLILAAAFLPALRRAESNEETVAPISPPEAIETTFPFPAVSETRDSSPVVGGMGRELESVAAALASTIEEIRAGAEFVVSLAKETTDQSTGVSGAADNASGDIQTIAAAAEQLNASIGEIAARVADSVRVASTGVEGAERTGEAMSTLAEATRDIGDVVRLIRSIAARVNLLALNASIEAARAGDAGRGFAVVAGEVKNLAAQVDTAAGDITRRVESLRERASAAVSTITAVTTTIREVSSISSMIAAAIEQQSAATAEISRGVQRGADQTGAVTRGITDVLYSATETGDAATGVLSAAAALDGRTEALHEIARRFAANGY